MPAMSTLATFAQMVHSGWAAPEFDDQTRSKQWYFLVCMHNLRGSCPMVIVHVFVRIIWLPYDPYEGDSYSKDRSKLPRRKGRLTREEWKELWEVLVVCWSPDPLDRPTASELEASLRKIYQPHSKNDSWLLLPSLFSSFVYHPSSWSLDFFHCRHEIH